MARCQPGERGQSLIEFAFVLPIFLILALAIVDFGWALKDYITVTNSAREGARIGIVCSSDSAIKDRVRDHSSQLIAVDNVTVSWNPARPTATTCASGGYVEVTATYDHSFITPLGSFIQNFSGGSLTMSSTTRMRVE